MIDVAVVGAGPCGLAAAIAAQRAGLRAVTFDGSCLVSGIYGYPIPEAARIAIGTVRRFLEENDTPSQVIFACFGAAVLRAFEAAAKPD